jgi:ATPase subunit of ABC transporter with duplicated ATPase domains
MPKWQCCLFNFIHGPFLGIIQMHLLSYGETFLHAAAFCSNNEGIALAGDAQSGKSTFVKLISEDNSKRIISEDFCILNSNKEILSYPKQCRIYIDQLKDTLYYKNKKKCIEQIFDNLNIGSTDKDTTSDNFKTTPPTQQPSGGKVPKNDFSKVDISKQKALEEFYERYPNAIPYKEGE